MIAYEELKLAHLCSQQSNIPPEKVFDTLIREEGSNSCLDFMLSLISSFYNTAFGVELGFMGPNIVEVLRWFPEKLVRELDADVCFGSLYPEDKLFRSLKIESPIPL